MNMPFPRLTLFALTTCLALAGLSGCAIVDQKIGLNYARPDSSPVKRGGDITVTRFAPRPTVRNSSGEWVIGSLNNVHGVHQADLLADRSPEEWITDALLYELRQAGYTATYKDSLPAAVVHGVVITNMNAYLSVNKGTVSTDTRHELKFNTEVFVNGDKAKTFTVASRDDRTVPFDASKEEKERIMLQSLQDAMLKIVPEIITLIEKK
jgi:hypothetical protein